MEREERIARIKKEEKNEREKRRERWIKREKERVEVTPLFLQVWVVLVFYLILFQTIHPLLLLTHIILLALNYKKKSKIIPDT